MICFKYINYRTDTYTLSQDMQQLFQPYYVFAPLLRIYVLVLTDHAIADVIRLAQFYVTFESTLQAIDNDIWS